MAKLFHRGLSWIWRCTQLCYREPKNIARNIWAASWQNQENDSVPREDSDQPGHPPSLTRVFDVCMKKAWVLSYPLSTKRKLWSDWADAQADPSLRWAHSHHFVGFVMWRLIQNESSFYITVNNTYPKSRNINHNEMFGVPFNSILIMSNLTIESVQILPDFIFA